MNQDEVYQEFIAAEAILKGHFILSSGLHSDTYLQCARVLMHPSRAELLCAELANRVRSRLAHHPNQRAEDHKNETPHDDLGIDIVVAPAMGGVIVGYEMGRQLRLPSVFCEREGGQFTLRRGFTMEPGSRVLLVEDVVTTGKSSIETVKCVEEYGGKVIAEASLIDRSSGNHGLPFPLISLLSMNVPIYAETELPPALAAIPAVKPGSRWLKSA